MVVLGYIKLLKHTQKFVFGTTPNFYYSVNFDTETLYPAQIAKTTHFLLIPTHWNILQKPMIICLPQFQH